MHAVALGTCAAQVDPLYASQRGAIWGVLGCEAGNTMGGGSGECNRDQLEGCGKRALSPTGASVVLRLLIGPTGRASHGSGSMRRLDGPT